MMCRERELLLASYKATVSRYSIAVRQLMDLRGNRTAFLDQELKVRVALGTCKRAYADLEDHQKNHNCFFPYQLRRESPQNPAKRGKEPLSGAAANQSPLPHALGKFGILDSLGNGVTADLTHYRSPKRRKTAGVSDVDTPQNE
jgi:hypothetical protein